LEEPVGIEVEKQEVKEIKLELKDYQRAALKFLYDTPKAGLFLEMRLGKTVITLQLIADLFAEGKIKRVLVIAPSRVAEGVWQKENTKWGHNLLMGEIVAKTKKAKRMEVLQDPNLQVVVISVGLLDFYDKNTKGNPHAIPFDMVVYDESSLFRSHSAKRFKIAQGCFDKVNRAILLTGTPSPNGVQGLWAQIYLLDKGERLGKNITAYRNKFCVPGRSFGPGQFDWKPKPTALADITKLTSGIVVTMKRKDYLDLPDAIMSEEYFDLPREALKQYKIIEQVGVLRGKASKEDPYGIEQSIVASTPGVAVQKLRQVASGAVYTDGGVRHIHDAKLKALEELLEITPGNVLLFYNFVHEKDTLIKAFPKALIIRDKKGELDWATGQHSIAIVHPETIKFGVDLTSGGNIIIWYGMPNNLETYLQANERIQGMNQTKVPLIHHLMARNTVDEDVYQSILRKENLQDAVYARLRMKNQDPSSKTNNTSIETILNESETTHEVDAESVNTSEIESKDLDILMDLL
jgi:SNF2 family DNA or RNA helicase